jgi:hypothetical protein
MAVQSQPGQIVETLFQKYLTPKTACEVAQGVGPGFKPQHCKKKKIIIIIINKNTREEKHRDTERRHVTTEAETGGMLPLAKKLLEPPGAETG